MYQGFAQVYDMFMDNIPYDKWGKYIIKLLRENGITEGNVVELGCGTGKITRRLRNVGFNMTGIDISEEMLEIATQGDTQGITYVNMDMRDFSLPFKADAIVSVCDSMNYLMDEDELENTFANVYNCLKDKGVFIFDMKSEYFYKSILKDKTFAENKENASLIWQNYYYDEDMINEYDLTIFAKKPKSSSYVKYTEIQYQRAYPLKYVLNLLKEMDFSSVMVYNAFTKKEPTIRSQRFYFVCRKEET